MSAAIDEMDLARYRTQITQTYSGGNKRKLCLAVALIAAPRVVFLGEPAGRRPTSCCTFSHSL